MSALKQPQWWESQPAPYSIVGKLDLAARRVMGGRHLFDALKSVSGSDEALAYRLKVWPSTVAAWRRNDCYVPRTAVARVAAALNIPLSKIPTRPAAPDALVLAGADIGAGVPFHEAIVRRQACTRLSRELGVTKKTVALWCRVRGISPSKLAAVAKLLGCNEGLLPLGRAKGQRRPLSEEELRNFHAMNRDPEVQAKRIAYARARPRVGFRWVKVNRLDKGACA